MITEHTICRLLLKELMKEVKKNVSKEDIQKSWAWKSCYFSKTVEFHGPNDFYWNGQGCCLWYAKVKGWEAYLKKIGIIE
jgi:hypothetical protein